MTEDGKKIKTLLSQLSKFYEQIALLLETASALMKEEGWTVAYTNVFGGLSYTTANPQGWIPRSFFILYGRESLPHISGFVSVVLGERGKEFDGQEPLLTAGWFDYGLGKQMGKRFNYDWPHWHLKMPNRNDEGRLITAEVSLLWPKEPFSGSCEPARRMVVQQCK